MAKKKAKATKRTNKPAPRKTAAKKVVKKAANVVRKPLKTKKKSAPKRKAVTKRIAPKKTVKKAARKPVRKVVKRTAPKPKAKAVTKKAKAITKVVTPRVKAKPVKKPAARKQAAVALPVPARLQRERKRLPEAELEAFDGEGADQRLLSSARAGHDELRTEMRLHTEASPELTAGDVDAKWQDAYAVGDEAPGGDNMTPDQDRVDDIGKAMGVVYDDDEELMGGEEINERDAHRWELDPASKEDDEDL
jgi:hypothetical protein